MRKIKKELLFCWENRQALIALAIVFLGFITLLVFTEWLINKI